jgi:hypothetical protein
MNDGNYPPLRVQCVLRERAEKIPLGWALAGLVMTYRLLKTLFRAIPTFLVKIILVKIHGIVIASTDILLAPLTCSKFSHFRLFDGGCLQAVVDQINSKYGSVEIALYALSRWLALFQPETPYATEVLETFKLQLVVGLRCRRVFGRVPNTLDQYLQTFQQTIYPELLKKYRGIDPSSSEVFYFHHGLRHLDGRVKAKLKNRDFLDIGAFNGDSALALSEYGRAIYCIEPDPIRVAEMRKILAANPNYTANVHLFHLGISGKSTGVEESGGSACRFITVDDFVEKNHLTLGFIKADVEGHGLEVVTGAAKSIARYRPVFSFSCYHAFTEMYNISMMLMDLLPNYHFEWHSENRIDWAFFELSFAGYPREALEGEHEI